MRSTAIIDLSCIQCYAWFSDSITPSLALFDVWVYWRNVISFLEKSFRFYGILLDSISRAVAFSVFFFFVLCLFFVRKKLLLFPKLESKVKKEMNGYTVTVFCYWLSLCVFRLVVCQPRCNLGRLQEKERNYRPDYNEGNWWTCCWHWQGTNSLVASIH